MKKLMTVILAMVLVFSAFAGGTKDNSKAGTGPIAANGKPVKIGVSMSTTQNLFFSKMAQIIQNDCKKKGVECVVSDERNDVNRQISSIENFVSSGCTAIIAVAFNPDGIKDAVKKAVAKGVYVMTYDGYVDGAQGSMNLDNYDYGMKTGTMAAEWVNSNPALKAQPVIEAGIFDYPDISIIIDRAKGIKDGLAKAPNIKVVAQQKAGIGDEGNIQGENFLAAHPNIQIICGINDTGVLGAYEVFKAANHLGNNIGLFGADGDPKALELISKGTSYRGTVMSGAYDAFPHAVDICIAASQGQKVDGKIIYPTVPVTSANVSQFLNN